VSNTLKKAIDKSGFKKMVIADSFKLKGPELSVLIKNQDVIPKIIKWINSHGRIS